MKIGRMKYLELLDLSRGFDEERSLIIEPLAKIYKEVGANAKSKIREHLQRVESEPEKVLDSEMEITSHDLLKGIVDDIAYEYDLQKTAIATALILVAQSYLHSKFQSIVSAYNYFEEPYKMSKLRDLYFSLGNKVGGVSWAEAVKSGSDYTRHFEEWKISPTKLEKTNAKGKATNLISKLDDKKQRETAKTLVGLGFTEEEVLDKRANLAPRIVAILNLHDPNEFSRLTSIWLDAIMRTLHSKFDSRDPMPDKPNK